jgi:predicted metal-dependent phosphoesterase TrpH
MRIDLHSHTEASHDCRTPLALIPGRCLERNLNVLAVTDHDQVWGAIELQALAADQPHLTVIVGEEISTREGEIIGLFLQSLIPPGLSPEETVAEIKNQGGLVLLPHGFDPLKVHRLRPAALARVADSIDIIESYNARISRPTWNRAASEWARVHHCAESAGSDAHLLSRIGDAWVEAPTRAIQSGADLLLALREGHISGTWTHPAIAFVQKFLATPRGPRPPRPERSS